MNLQGRASVRPTSEQAEQQTSVALASTRAARKLSATPEPASKSESRIAMQLLSHLQRISY